MIEVKVPPAVLLYGKRELRREMLRAGREVSAAARAKIASGAGSGRVYRGSGGANGVRPYVRGRYQASAPGEAPVSVTKTLAGRVLAPRPFRARAKSVGVWVRDAAFYALMLENGAKGGLPGQSNKRRGGRVAVVGRRVLEPRPFLSTAAEELMPTLGPRIAAAAVESMRLKVGR